MKNDVAISVVIPMYNQEKYIREAIFSVLNQTFKDFEIIITDDASTDNSYKICTELSERFENIRIIHHICNRGEIVSRCAALNAARGKYVQFMDSDDFLMPDALKSMYEVAEQTQADWVHTVIRLQPLDGGGSVIRPGGKLAVLRHDWGSDHEIDKTTIIPYSPEKRLLDYINDTTFGDLPYGLFKRSFLIENEIDFLGLYCHLELLMKARIFVKVCLPTYIWRQHQGQDTHMKRTMKYVGDMIDWLMEISEAADQIVARIEYLQTVPRIGELLKTKLASGICDWRIKRHGFYQNGIENDLYDVVEERMRRHIGERASWLATFLFHSANAYAFGYTPFEYYKKVFLASLNVENHKL